MNDSFNPEDLAQQLNPEQYKAVTAPGGNVLVLAGAGSGKTRVLVYRIAWLLKAKQVFPASVLAVTFTNKAANEMRSRLESMLGMSLRAMWVGTFHGLCHRMLRIHFKEAGLSENFQIMDESDQARLVKRIHKGFNLDETKWPAKQSQWFINGNKDQGLRAKDVIAQDPTSAVMLRVYQMYEETCRKNSLVDFAELLLRSFEILQEQKDLLSHYQQKFKHILVDEFQDTNGIQYAWVRLLARGGASLMVVGDDDQSIYSWRGAKVENMQHFCRDFANVETIKLEENYRSTSVILEAANAVIAQNSGRLGKQLWTQSGKGDQIGIYSAFNEVDEARFIVERIESFSKRGIAKQDMAILYRSNAQSRVLEEALLYAGIPYRIYGGFKFFDRAEIKDVLAYLRLILSRNDDDAFERAVSTPTRGVGDTTLQSLRDYAKGNGLSLWQATETLINENKVSPRAKNSLQGFLTLVNNLCTDTTDLPLEKQFLHVINASGLRAHYAKDKTDKGDIKVENLDELITAAEQFGKFFTAENYEENVNYSPLTAFLTHAALEAGDFQSEEFNDAVKLMTLHSAKGLEFPLVFLTGMEEYLFPHQLSMQNPKALEEERRLCYVGITRAMQKLYLTYAAVRRLHGSDMYRRPSRFLQEIPERLKDDIR
jgi:DNA helicase II / ATP-dependent DNA helicase PcrA